MTIVDRGVGPPVVMIPGVQGRWEWMSPAVDALAERCRIVTFSLCDEPSSGFDHDPVRGIDNYLAQLERVFETARLSDAVLIGVSFGGPIATEFAARHPERVRALVLVSALPTDWTPDRRAKFYLTAPLLLVPVFLLDAPIRAQRELRAALPRVVDRLHFSAMQLWRVTRYVVWPARLAQRIRLLLQYRFQNPATIRRPTLVITGERELDRVVPVEATCRYLQIPHARHEVLPRTGHLGLITRPQSFADAVARFIREIEIDDRRATA